jgi:hypothetical protein
MASCILNLGIRRRSLLAFIPATLSPRKELPVPVGEEANRPQSRFRRGNDEISLHAEI